MDDNTSYQRKKRQLINLTHEKSTCTYKVSKVFNLPRLSVDIDLDLSGNCCHQLPST